MTSTDRHEKIILIVAGVSIVFAFAIKMIILLGFSNAPDTIVTTIESNNNNLMSFIFGYYFCGSVAKKPVNNIENAEQVDINELKRSAENKSALGQ